MGCELQFWDVDIKEIVVLVSCKLTQDLHAVKHLIIVIQHTSNQWFASVFIHITNQTQISKFNAHLNKDQLTTQIFTEPFMSGLMAQNNYVLWLPSWNLLISFKICTWLELFIMLIMCAFLSTVKTIFTNCYLMSVAKFQFALRWDILQLLKSISL